VIQAWQFNLRRELWMRSEKKSSLVSALVCEGRTIWIVDAHRDDGKRFVVHADEIQTAFVTLEIGDSSAVSLCVSWRIRPYLMFSH
jgi:hypothetical protein